MLLVGIELTLSDASNRPLSRAAIVVYNSSVPSPGTPTAFETQFGSYGKNQHALF